MLDVRTDATDLFFTLGGKLKVCGSNDHSPVLSKILSTLQKARGATKKRTGGQVGTRITEAHESQNSNRQCLLTSLMD